MADKHIEIFKGLKNFQVNPPKNFFRRIWWVLVHHDNSTEPEINAEYSDDEIEAFRSLQEYAITPPAYSTLKIKENVFGTSDINATTKIGKVVGLKYLGRIAAAVLIISCSVWALYYATYMKQHTTPVVLNNQKINSSTTDNISVSTNNPIVNAGKTLMGSVKQINTVASSSGMRSKKNIHLKVSANSKKATDRGYTNSGAKLTDNDILLTLVNYHYSEYAPLMRQIEKNNRIVLNQFSYINISDKMNNILKKMYATKRNNKPTRKAKRLKAKLEKWKRADEKHFDSGTRNNPLDVIDLSEFILK